MLKSIIITSLIILIPLSAVAAETQPAKPTQSDQQIFVEQGEQPSLTDRIKQWFRDDMVVKPTDDREMSPIEPEFEDPAGSGPSVTAFGWEPIQQMTADWSQFGYFYRRRMDTLAAATNLPASQIRPARPSGEFGYQLEFIFCTSNCDYWNGTDEILIRIYMPLELTSGNNAGHYRYFPIDVIRATVSYDANPLHYPANTTPTQEELFTNSHVVLKVKVLDRVNCYAEPYENDDNNVPGILAKKQAWYPCGNAAAQASNATDVATGEPIGAWSDYRGNVDTMGIGPTVNYNQSFITPYGVSELGNAGNKTALPDDITLEIYTNADRDIIVEDEGGKLKQFILNQTDLDQYLLYTNVFPVVPKPTGKTGFPYFRKVTGDLIWTFDHRMGWPTRLAPLVLDNPSWGP